MNILDFENSYPLLYNKLTGVLTSEGIEWWLDCPINELDSHTPSYMLLNNQIKPVEDLIDSYFDPSYG